MTAEPIRQATIEEYLDFERSSQEKHEFLEGQIYAMGGASVRHNLIVGNLVGELRQLLKGRSCLVFPSDLRVHATEGLYAYPDVTVVCGTPEFDDETKDTLVNPTLIVEVLSESTESYDRGEKFARYRSLPSLAEYVLVSQDRVSVEHHARQPDGHWLTTYVEDLDGTLSLPALGCELSVAEIFDKVDLS